MYVIGIEANIAGKRFSRIISLKVETDFKRIGTTAVLELPTSARLTRAGEFISEVETAKQFHVGDPVVISAGYNGDLVEEFRGYVRRISPAIPLKLELEDEVYHLRRKNLQKSWRKTTLKEVLEFVLEGTDVELVGEVPAINFTKYYLKNVSAALALQKLKDKYGLIIYFREPGKLFVGLTSDTDLQVVKYTIGRNVVDHDLEWLAEDDVNIRVKAILIAKNGSQTDVEVGDPEGELRTLHFYDLADEQSLKERAQEELLKFKREGYKGSLRGYLVPVCRVGNTVRLNDETYDNNNEGDYLAEKVVTTIDDSGARRRVKVGLKVG